MLDQDFSHVGPLLDVGAPSLDPVHQRRDVVLPVSTSSQVEDEPPGLVGACIVVRDEIGVGSGAEPLKASNVRTEEGSDGYAVRDGDVDDVDGDCAVGGWNICSDHVSWFLQVCTSTCLKDSSSW